MLDVLEALMYAASLSGTINQSIFEINLRLKCINTTAYSTTFRQLNPMEVEDKIVCLGRLLNHNLQKQASISNSFMHSHLMCKFFFILVKAIIFVVLFNMHPLSDQCYCSSQAQLLQRIVDIEQLLQCYNSSYFQCYYSSYDQLLRRYKNYKVAAATL